MNYGIILAAGKGTRLGADRNKVLLPLGGKPLFYYSIKAFKEAGIFDKIVVVAGEGETSVLCEALGEEAAADLIFVTGGRVRQESVYNGLKVLKDFAEGEVNLVLIHDSARPFVTPDEVRRVAEGAKTHGAATLAVPVKDTIKIVDSSGMVEETLEREKLWAVATPQGFSLKLILGAHENAIRDNFLGTDDCSLVERLGEPVKIIEGSYRNFKVTTVEDLQIASSFLD